MIESLTNGHARQRRTSHHRSPGEEKDCREMPTSAFPFASLPHIPNTGVKTKRQDKVYSHENIEEMGRVLTIRPESPNCVAELFQRQRKYLCETSGAHKGLSRVLT